jgi:hypothetical protein
MAFVRKKAEFIKKLVPITLFFMPALASVFGSHLSPRLGPGSAIR